MTDSKNVPAIIYLSSRSALRRPRENPRLPSQTTRLGLCNSSANAFIVDARIIWVAAPSKLARRADVDSHAQVPEAACATFTMVMRLPTHVGMRWGQLLVVDRD
jgi:hypothetical protein